MRATLPAILLAVGGPLAVGAAWLLVRAGRASVWTAMGVTLGALGALALLTGEVRGAPAIGRRIAVSAGVGAGFLLYAATAAFMAIVGRWPPLARHAAELYDQRRGRSLPAALAISVLLVVPGEELLWRGIVQGLLETVTPPVAAAALGWLVYVGMNAVSGSVPIVLGAVVGGAVWAALALWSGGVIASICCHAAWTTLMIVAPPVPERSR